MERQTLKVQQKADGEMPALGVWKQLRNPGRKGVRETSSRWCDMRTNLDQYLPLALQDSWHYPGLRRLRGPPKILRPTQ